MPRNKSVKLTEAAVQAGNEFVYVRIENAIDPFPYQRDAMDLAQELNRLADIYRGHGYEVTVRPGPDQLPPFAKDFRVEIVGRRGDGGVLVAVKKNRDEMAADRHMQSYAEIIGNQRGGVSIWPSWRGESERPRVTRAGSFRRGYRPVASASGRTQSHGLQPVRGHRRLGRAGSGYADPAPRLGTTSRLGEHASTNAQRNSILRES